MEALGLQALGPMDKPLLVEQDKLSGSDTPDTYREFEQVFVFQDGNRQNQFKDETCTYCNKKGHTETFLFAKGDDDKLTRMAQKVCAAMVGQITAMNKQSMESILETQSKMNLEGQGQLLSQEVEVLKTMNLKWQQMMKVTTNHILTVGID